MFEYQFDSKLMFGDLLEHVVAEYYPKGFLFLEKTPPGFVECPDLYFGCPPLLPLSPPPAYLTVPGSCLYMISSALGTFICFR